MKIRLVIEIENVASFIKHVFYQKRVSLKMRKHALFYANKSYKLAVVIFIPTPPFSK